MATWINGEPVCVKRKSVARGGILETTSRSHEDDYPTHEEMVEAAHAPTEAELEADYKKQWLDCIIVEGML